MIEEFMLAANEAVAEHLSKAGAGALYRIHERPDPERVEEFCDLVASFGYRVPAEPRGDPARRTSSSSCARSRGSPRRSWSRTCCCAP